MLTLATHRRRMRKLLAPLFELTLEHPDLEGVLIGFVGEGQSKLPLARFVFRGESREMDRIRLGFFSVIHGDEVAGASTVFHLLMHCIQDPGIAHGLELFCYPVCNPTGFEDGTRNNRAGVDLNREFWRGSEHLEVVALEHELQQHAFHGLIALHADCDSPGLYAFARGAVITEQLLTPALIEAEGVLPRNTDVTIDGFSAEHGVIRDCHPGVLSAPPEQHPIPFEIILETPGRAPVSEQAEAAYRAVRAIMGGVPVLLSVAEGI